MNKNIKQLESKDGGLALLTLGALGIVFGDIGTSPLYAMREIFHGPHHLPVTQENVYGIISLIFWSITLIVTLKYVALIMKVNNDGEGGIMALISLIRLAKIKNKKVKRTLIILGLAGAALFYGDALITPAISVLSAVEGLEIVNPSLHQYIVPITLVILTLLFSIQRTGTATVGKLFGPVMVLWFSTLAIIGIHSISNQPSIIKALSPLYAASFILENTKVAFLALGSVVLAVTGAEALYADLGHFGRKPITRAWFIAVFPALMLNYLGQGALILNNPKAIENPFYLLVSDAMQLPLVILATTATIIASQAVISGAFSITKQAIRLDFLPVFDIKHTSEKSEGQIYIPFINWFLYASIVVLVIGFGSSTSLASAYGVSVTGTLVIDTILACTVIKYLWKKPWWLVGLIGSLFLFIDLSFFAANLTKITHGGWISIAFGAVAFICLTTWGKGRSLLLKRRRVYEQALSRYVWDLIHSDKSPIRVPGTAVFLSANSTIAPISLVFNVRHNKILHERVVVFSVETTNQPHVPIEERIIIDELEDTEDGIVLVKAKFGFADEPNVPLALRQAKEMGLDVDAENASYFITRSTISIGEGKELSKWRKLLFITLNRNSGTGTQYFRLPANRVVVLGTTIDL